MINLLLKKRIGIIALTLALVGAGLYLFTQMSVQMYPQTRRPTLFVRFNHSGYSAVDFSDNYGEEIETMLQGVNGISLLSAEYGRDSSRITAEFDWDTNADDAEADVNNVLTSADSILPDTVTKRVYFSSGESSDFFVAILSSPTHSPEELYLIADSALSGEFASVDEADEITIDNVDETVVEVTLNPMKLLAQGIEITDVEAAFRKGYKPTPLGAFTEGSETYSLRLKGDVGDLYDLPDLVITQRGDALVTLRNVAEITIEKSIPDRFFMTEGGRGLQITAVPKEGGNVKKMVDDVKAIMATAQEEGRLPADTTMTPLFDPAEYIDQAIRNVVQAGIIGASLAILIVLLILGEFRNTLIVGLSLPISLIISFVPLYLAGITLNLISLGGMALAVGMVVDAAIVVMENIHRMRQEHEGGWTRRELREVIIAAMKQVALPVIVSTLTSVLVFLPISMTSPLTNAILGEQSRTVVFALLSSLFVSLVIIPVLAYYLYHPNFGGKSRRGSLLSRISSRGLQRAVRVYKGCLAVLLTHTVAKWGLLAFSSGLFLFAVFVYLPQIPSELIAAPASSRINLFAFSKNDLERNKIVEDAAPLLQEQITEVLEDDIESFSAMVRDGMMMGIIQLKGGVNPELTIDTLSEEFVDDSNWNYNISNWDPATLPLPRTEDLQISFSGVDDEIRLNLLEEAGRLVEEAGLYRYIDMEPTTYRNQEVIFKAREHVIEGFQGISETSLLSLVRLALNGTTTLSFDTDAGILDINAAFPDEFINSREKLANFPILYQGNTVPLKHFFDFAEEKSLAEIISIDGEKSFRLYAGMKGDSAPSDIPRLETEVKKLLDKNLKIPGGYNIIFENGRADVDDAVNTLYFALIASVILIYLLLSFQFGSLRLPLIILVTIPLAMIGVIFSLRLFNSTISLNSMLGSILLAGIVVNNAIIMIDFYLAAYREYGNRTEALVQVAALRFPPIIITTLTTIFGMLPIALGLGEGANIIQPLGIAVSGGLLISTLFTLFVVPVLLSFYTPSHQNQ